MAGADALGGFVSLTAQESFAIEYWPLELYKLSLAPPPRELQGRSRSSPVRAGGIGRAIVARAGRRRCLRGRPRPRRRRRRVTPSRALATRGSALTRRRHRRGRGRRRLRRRPSSASAASTSSSPTPGIASSAPIQDTTLAEWNRNHAVLGTRLLPRRARGVPGPRAPGHRRLDRLRRLQERARRGQERGRLLVGQGRRAAPRALPGRGGRAAGIRVNTVNPDAVLRARGSGTRPGARSAPPTTASRPTSSRSTTARAPRWASTSCRRTSRQAVLHFASDARSGKTTGNLLNVDGGVPAAYPR